jgi:hypothetical protein
MFFSFTHSSTALFGLLSQRIKPIELDVEFLQWACIKCRWTDSARHAHMRRFTTPILLLFAPLPGQERERERDRERERVRDKKRERERERRRKRERDRAV